MQRASQQGFTLMEVLIAVTITSVIGLGVWQVINSIILSRDRVNEVAVEFEALQRTMLMLERDIRQLVNRPARDIYGDFQPALSNRQDEFALLLTRQGWRNPLGTRRSNLQRVAWEYTGNDLRRRYWVVLDQGMEDSSRDGLLTSGVTEFLVRFLDSNRNWVEQWPADAAMAGLEPGARPDFGLPLGVEITLEHERFGELVRTFALPDFNAGLAQGIVTSGNEAAVDNGDDEDTGSDENQQQGGAATPDPEDRQGGNP